MKLPGFRGEELNTGRGQSNSVLRGHKTERPGSLCIRGRVLGLFESHSQGILQAMGSTPSTSPSRAETSAMPAWLGCRTHAYESCAALTDCSRACQTLIESQTRNSDRRRSMLQSCDRLILCESVALYSSTISSKTRTAEPAPSSSVRRSPSLEAFAAPTNSSV